MSCPSVRRNLSAYVDRSLPAVDRSGVGEHLAQCPECACEARELAEVRSLLRRVPVIPTPRWLSTNLLVLASRERVRQQRYSSWRALARDLTARAQLAVDNLMRPVALPVAGGLVAALFLFSMLVPSLQSLSGPLSERPTGLYTEPTVATVSPFGVSDEVVVELVLDSEGRIIDYAVPNRQVDRELIRQIGNMILFTSFHPATSFGQPTSGRLTVSFSRSHIVVKG